MKILSWNCGLALRRKVSYVNTCMPDIAVIQECEKPEKISFRHKGLQLTDSLWVGPNKNIGIGIFAFNGYKLELFPQYDESLKWIIPVRVRGKENFNLLGVWAVNNPLDRRASYIGQVYLALQKYADLLGEPTILVGDFNSSIIWDDIPRVGNHSTVLELLARHNIFSTYHIYYGEEQGKESRKTYYFNNYLHQSYHTDFCFASQTFLDRMERVEVGSYGNWHGISDHCPLIIDFKPAPSAGPPGPNSSSPA